MKKKHIILGAVAVLLTAALVWLLWGNVTVGLTRVTVTEENLPLVFDGYRIAHVSDLHNSRLWEKVIERLREAQPDIICITGDIVDSRRTDVDTALAFAAEAMKLAPCYYVTGNHETRLADSDYDRLLDGLRSCGVTVLQEAVTLEKDGQSITLMGCFSGDSEALPASGGYGILLSHHPENFAIYASAGYELVLSGHAHGGQVRLPFIGGVLAPNQGPFPQYDSGLYSQGITDMLVSRGIGNSSFPIRVNNRPEVLLVTLRVDMTAG